MKRIHVLLTTASIVVAVGFGAYVYYRYSIRDNIGPEISANSSKLVMSIADGKERILDGMKAIDDKDGDVSETLLVESVTMSESGKCTVVYAAYDHSNNVTRATRNLEYTDYESPRFHVDEPLRFPVGSYDALQKAVTATDCIDGDISEKIRVRTSDNTAYTSPGIYDYELEVTNSLGETVALPISVEYYSDSHENRLYRPEVKLTDYLVYLNVGDDFNPEQYEDYISVGNELYAIDEKAKSKLVRDDISQKNTDQYLIEKEGKVASGVVNRKAITITGKVDTMTAGVYTISYTCKTAEGYSGTIQMTVVVQE